MKLRIKKKLDINRKFWSQAKKVIPNGNTFLSKRLDVEKNLTWPVYYKKAKGCFIWDINNKKYIDVGLMGVGTNVLGYNNNEVNSAVKKVVNQSNMSSLNCIEELNLAKKLIRLHPWAQMAKFARTGGEANALAIRIARAYTNSEKVAICGYHGWHDWYLAANLKKRTTLDNHLKKELNILGVPRSLSGSVYSFNYNDFDGMKKIIKKEKIKIIKMEVKRFDEPKNNFLSKVRNFTKKNNIILIFDECTTGFRETLGGLHKKYRINPDIAIFGKAMGNGFAITAVIGKKKLMLTAKDTFASSTFWSERIGYAAALKTIEIFEKKKIIKNIKKNGKLIKRNWEKILTKHHLKYQITGSDSLPCFKILRLNEDKFIKKLTAKMLEKGYLFKNFVYVSQSHTKKILYKYFNALDKSIGETKKFL
tara:strand:- start:11943 stop:13205 length:1263 start_codon:yes stop_codon:yes gene_type:complete